MDFAQAIESTQYLADVERDLARFNQVSEKIKQDYKDKRNASDDIRYRGVSKNDLLKYEGKRLSMTPKNALGNTITVKPIENETMFAIEANYPRIACVKMATFGIQYPVEGIKVNGVLVSKHNVIDKSLIIKQCNRPTAKVSFIYR